MYVGDIQSCNLMPAGVWTEDTVRMQFLQGVAGVVVQFPHCQSRWGWPLQLERHIFLGAPLLLPGRKIKLVLSHNLQCD